MVHLPVRGLLLISALLSLGSTSPSSPSHQLTFEQRVEAQRAIERVYYSHQTGATESFDVAVPTALLEQKVRTYLQQSVALDRIWGSPVTAEALRSEMEREARGTRMPERLRELYAALGNDPVLVQECLVRPVLVDRLTRTRSEPDQAMLPHTDLDLAAAVPVVASDVSLSDPAALVGSPWSRSVAAAGCATDDVWDNESLDDPPSARSWHSAVWTGSLMLVWGGYGSAGLLNNGLRYDPATDTTTPISSAGAPAPRSRHTAVWTGTRMLIWGGLGDTTDLGDGASYDPVADTWSPMTMTNAPTARSSQSAVWTGTLLLVWGGYDDSTSSYLRTGARYNPSTDTWSTMSIELAPSVRSGALSVWTGSLMVVWAGQDSTGVLNTGARYNPTNDQWTQVEPTGAPANPNGWAAVWSGSLMLTWGNGGGARYNPSTNLWLPMSSVNQPSDDRYLHQAVWTGSAMFVWGGETLSGGTYPTDGGLYNPTANSWTTTSNLNVPAGRYAHSMVWTGNSAIIWGGYTSSASPVIHARYDPAADTWTNSIPPPGLPSPRSGHTAVWTGSYMIVWGGGGSPTGSRYNPALDTWTPTSTAGQPINRFGHTAIWTGSRMIVWEESSTALNDGGRYDPIADVWTPISLINAPSPRSGHAAVWTGTEMIVWGGVSATGGRYSPATDSWVPVSTTNAPAWRAGQTGVWAGNRLVVWGDAGVGGRYDPSADQWTSVSTIGAPDPRFAFHSAIGAGSMMLVIGGYYDEIVRDRFNVPLYEIRHWHSGDRYDPSTDSWLAAGNGVGARRGQSLIWTGKVVVVWAGQYSDYINGFTLFYIDHQEGARYDPATNTWTAISTAGAPSARSNAGAVWAGDRMIVWGGQHLADLGDGGMYGIADPSNDVDDDGDGWTECQGDCDDTRADVYPGAPEVCDGRNNDCNAPGWPALPANELDADKDGLSTCRGDCDDAHAAVYPGAPQICDGLNDDCNAPGWPAVPANEADADGDGSRVCAGDCDDTHASVYPGAPQICDGLNNDCNAAGWPSLVGTNERDDDGDGLTECQGDCDDTHASVRPGAPQLCDGLNNDCNAPGWPAVPVNEADADQDSFRICAGDCDDTRASVYPGAPQLCDGINNNCSAPGWPAVPANEANADGDGFRICAGDCDDTRASVYPGAPQLCDGINNDCSAPGWPAVPANEANADQDGFRICAGDCDDTRASVYPGAPQVCGDGLNNDCASPTWPNLFGTNEHDDDNDGISECQGDCDDSNADVFPGAPQICDGVNNNCADPSWPAVPLAESDNDQDGYLSCAGSLPADCDDNDGSVWGTPSEVQSLRWQTGTSLMLWTPPSARGGLTDAYDTLRATSSTGFLNSATCLETADGSDTTATDNQVPAPSEVFYYLVRAVNTCPAGQNVGTLGTSSNGTPRPGRTCP